MAAAREGVNVVAVLLKEELKKILFKVSENREKRRLWARQWILRGNRSAAIETLREKLASEDQEGYGNHLGTSADKFDELLS